MQYYIIVNGSQLGPYSIEELRYQGLTPESMVWREGLSEWVAASTLAELSAILYDMNAAQAVQNPAPAPQQPVNQYPDYNNGYNQPATPQYGAPQQPAAPQYGAPQQPVQQYGAPQQPYQQYNEYGQPVQQPYGQQMFNQPQHQNWMPWAIVVTILAGCSCVGLVLGILAIVNANKANNFFKMGMNAEGEAANKTAKTLVIINAVLMVISIIFYIIYFAVIGGSMAAIYGGY
ncbi:MAG: GYF domain-containing protein [Muribaculaceae bacterium]|nr:GYF domain-containing protein [Muribaculaceae bacterium]